MKVRDVIAGVGRSLDSCLIDAVLDHHRRKRSPSHERLTDDHMTPGGRHAIRADANLDPMRVHRTIVATAHIILTRPDELYWSVAETFRDYRRFARHMRINYGAPAETAARIFSVESYLFR